MHATQAYKTYWSKFSLAKRNFSFSKAPFGKAQRTLPPENIRYVILLESQYSPSATRGRYVLSSAFGNAQAVRPGMARRTIFLWRCVCIGEVVQALN